LKDHFSTFHPVVNFVYFAAVIVFSMFFMHPVFLGISLASAVIYSIYLNGMRAVKFNLLGMLPMLLVVALLNPLLSHAGATILLYINDNPITLESILYGVASAVMFVSVIIWFSCYNAVMTSDKFIYLFGKLIPALSLILSMTLRFVPKFKAQIRVISNAQKCIGRDVSNGSVLKRARNGIKIISILVTWALENAIETADSMRCRGYGLKGRTAFSNYRFDKRDQAALAVIFGLVLLLIAGMALGENNMQYFPVVAAKPVTPLSFVFYAGYAALLLFPVAINVTEDVKWARLQSEM
jgi:energy-coupling factor transport system permease protein